MNPADGCSSKLFFKSAYQKIELSGFTFNLLPGKERSRKEVCKEKDSQPKEDCNKHLEDLYSFLRLAVRLGGREHTPELQGQIVVLNVLRTVFKLIRH